MKPSRYFTASFFKMAAALAAVFFLVCLGCEKPTNTWGNAAALDGSANGIISGQIVLNAANPNIKAAIEVQQLSGVAGAEIWLETLPDKRTFSGENGFFTLQQIPPGEYRLVSRITDISNRVFKRRSEILKVGIDPVNAGNVVILPANARISGILRDSSGTPLSMAVLKLWGEFFTTDNNGRFVSPPVPDENQSAEVFIETPGFKAMSFTASFSAALPQSFSITLANAGSEEFSPFISIFSAADKVLPSQQLAFKAQLQIPPTESDFMPQITWSATQGAISATANGLESTWIAPDREIIATISARVTGKSGLSAAASLTITIGQGNDTSEPGNGAQPETPQTATPTPPLNFAVTAIADTVSLSWTAVEKAEAYNIYWANSIEDLAQKTNSIKVATPGYIHKQLEHGRSYFYFLTARNQGGESAASNIASATIDTKAPIIASLSPGNQSIGIASSTSFVIEFDEQIIAANGFIYIYRKDESLHEKLAIDSIQVAISGTRLEFFTTAPLTDDEEYFIRIDSASIKDLRSNSFAGILDNSTWQFKTRFEFNEELLWNHVMVNASAAWQYSTGKGVIVAVIDTGIFSSHPDLSQQLAPPGKDFYNDGVFLEDGLGHGTHVAGIIAARGNNGGSIGIAPNSRIYISKVFSRTGTGPSAAMMVTAIEDAVENGAKIINMSIGTLTFNSVYETAAAWARERGSILFAAAGNDGSSQLRYLAACPSVFSVGATTQTDQRWPPSNTSDDLDFSGPGDMIISTLPGPSYGFISGTSMASPHLAAVAALVWSRNPSFTGEQVYAALRYGSVDLGTYGKDPQFGHGRINALKALQYKPELDINPARIASIRAIPQQKPDFSCKNFAAGELLIKLKPGKTLQQALESANLTAEKISLKKRLLADDLMLISVPEGSEKDMAEKLFAAGETDFCELNAIISFSMD